MQCLSKIHQLISLFLTHFSNWQREKCVLRQMFCSHPMHASKQTLSLSCGFALTHTFWCKLFILVLAHIYGFNLHTYTICTHMQECKYTYEALYQWSNLLQYADLHSPICRCRKMGHSRDQCRPGISETQPLHVHSSSPMFSSVDSQWLTHGSKRQDRFRFSVKLHRK